MIADFLHLQDAIQQRAIHVGRLIQQYRHHAMTPTVIRNAWPHIVAATPHLVTIAVGVDRDSTQVIAVACPAVIFDGANDAEIRVWVAKLNEVRLVELDQAEKAAVAAKEAAERRILQELQEKFPNG